MFTFLCMLLQMLIMKTSAMCDLYIEYITNHARMCLGVLACVCVWLCKACLLSQCLYQPFVDPWSYIAAALSPLLSLSHSARIKQVKITHCSNTSLPLSVTLSLGNNHQPALCSASTGLVHLPEVFCSFSCVAHHCQIAVNVCTVIPEPTNSMLLDWAEIYSKNGLATDFYNCHHHTFISD